MICPFVVGQKVVCIQERWYPWTYIYGVWSRVECSNPVPKKGEICKIMSIAPSDSPQEQFELTLEGYGNQTFAFRGFRPLNERPKEASIEIFKKLLNPKQLEKV